MKFKKTYNNIMIAFQDFKAPCVIEHQCSKECPFFPFYSAFNLTCAGFCADYPKEAARIMGLEIIDEENG